MKDCILFYLFFLPWNQFVFSLRDGMEYEYADWVSSSEYFIQSNQVYKHIYESFPRNSTSLCSSIYYLFTY